MEKEFSSVPFQVLVLKYLWNNQSSFTFRSLLKEKYFGDVRCAYVFKWLVYFSETHGVPVSKVMMVDVCLHTKAVDGALAVFRGVMKTKITPSESSYIESKVKEFCRYQEVLDVLSTRSIPLVESGNLDDLELLLADAFAIGREQFGKGLDYFNSATIKRRIKERLSNRRFYSTWISELDRYLTLRSGQIVIFLGVTGRGKSMSMIYFAKVMMMQNLKVAFYTLQLPEDAIAARFDASMSNINLSDLKSHSPSIVKDIKDFKDNFAAHLTIKGFPSKFLTVDILKSHLDLLRSGGFDPDVVIVDYGNLMTGGEKRSRNNSRYEELGLIYEKLMAVAQEQDILILIPHQAKQSSWEKPLLTVSDASESSETVMVAPVVISINRNLEDEKNNQARLYIAKNSYGKDGVVVTINTDYEKGQFYVPYRKDSSRGSSSSAAPDFTKSSRKKKK